jgi:hypothetical protein
VVTGIRSHADAVIPAVGIFPNPSAGRVTIDPGINGQFRARIYGLTGTELQSFSLAGRQAVDLSGLRPGLYFLLLLPDAGPPRTGRLLIVK